VAAGVGDVDVAVRIDAEPARPVEARDVGRAMAVPAASGMPASVVTAAVPAAIRRMV
jgi:hypothetical protein